MSKLSGRRILEEVRKGSIIITPFDQRMVNPNSFNLRLGDTLKVYDICGSPYGHLRDESLPLPHCLDMHKQNPTITMRIPESGFELLPGVLYLAMTMEHTTIKGWAPMVEGRSSFARLGAEAHKSAGFGDNGFCGHWTLEMEVTHNLIIYPYEAVCQITFEPLLLASDETEPLEYQGKYCNRTEPVASEMWRDVDGTTQNPH